MFRMPFIATLQTLRTRAGLAALAVGVALMAAAFFSLPSRASTATVATDQASYATGDMVIITGSGWVPGEKVALEIVESALIHSPDTLYAVANSTGNIYQEYIVPDHAAGQTFTLTATGETSGSAGPTTFTSSASSAPASSSTAPSSATSSLTAPSSMTATGPATVTTDKGDYAPGETVYITGSGWEPGETVELLLEETPLNVAEKLYTIADGGGNIDAQYVVQDRDLGQTVVLTATGQTSHLTAQTTFTDSGSLSYNPTTQSLTISAGTSGSFVQIVTAPKNNGNFTASPVFNGTTNPKIQNSWVSTFPSSLGFTTTPSSGDSDSWTVTITIPAGTSAGTYSGNLKANPSISGVGQGGGTDIVVTVSGVCGNGSVESNEQCDGGSCCTSSCTFKSSGTACGSAADTDCDNPDTCNGSGACQTNHETDGTACTADTNECTNDVCSAGLCTHPNKSAGAACGSSSDTDCDNPDTCNGSGVCQVNHETDGTACTTDSNECTNDICGAGLCTHPNKAAGTACGSASDTDCDNPDTCNGSGVCQVNHEAAGTPCGDPTNTICNGADTCDGTGSCQANLAPNGTSCDDGNACTTGDTCSGGSCSVYTYNFTGFFQPVDNPGLGPTYVFNRVKAGNAIPTKFSLNCNLGLNIFMTNYPKSEKVNCTNVSSVDDIEETVTAGSSSLNYDPITNQYIYVWKTDKTWGNTCRKLTVRLTDGTDHVAYFNFTK